MTKIGSEGSSGRKDSIEPAIDFNELDNLTVKGEALEQLVRKLAPQINLEPSWTGRGPDGGRDLFLTERISGFISSHRIKWLVSCKDLHESGRSVTEKDEPNIRDKVDQHKADGYLLVTTTTASAALKQVIDELDKANGGPIHTKVWDRAELVEIILSKQCRDVFEQFFPESFKKLRTMSMEEALNVFRKNLPSGAFDSMISRVVPYLAYGISYPGRVISPDDRRQAEVIDEIVSLVLAQNDYPAAVIRAQELDVDIFGSLIRHIDEADYDIYKEFANEIIVHSEDKNIVLNAYQYLIEHNELTFHDRMRLATYLDDSGLELVYWDKVAEWIQDEILSNASEYSFWSDVDGLSTHTIIENVDVLDIQFNPTEGKSVLFSGELSMNLGLRYGNSRDEVLGEVSISASFDGTMQPESDSWSLDDVQVDTSSMYR